jgi:hypothetical protein
MAMAREMMSGGISAGAAKAINGGQNLTISAAGTTLATGTALTAGHNVITTCSSGAGVVLPSCEIGDEVFVFNGTSTNSLLVYPDAAANTINQLTAGVAGSIAPYNGALFKKASSTAWWVNVSA